MPDAQIPHPGAGEGQAPGPLPGGEGHGALEILQNNGGHPGFRVPLEAGKNFEDYRLTFARPSRPCPYSSPP